MKRKIGAGHLGAMARLGLHELGRALHPQGNGVQPSEIAGVAGNPTAGEVAAARTAQASVQAKNASVFGKSQTQAPAKVQDKGIDLGN